MRLAIRQTVVGVGIALAFLALWTGIYVSRYYTDDGSSLGYLLILLVLASLLLSASILLWRSLPLAIASAAGAGLLGYYAYFPMIMGFDGYKGGISSMKAGGWLGLAGSGVIILGGAPVFGRLAWRRGPRSRAYPFYAALALAAAGFGLVIVSLFLHFINVLEGTRNASMTYWSYPFHSPSLLMLVGSSVGIGLAALTALWPIAAVRDLILALAMLMLGIALFYPLLLAFNGLGQLGAGGWLAPAGALLAVAGAAAAILFEPVGTGEK